MLTRSAVAILALSVGSTSGTYAAEDRAGGSMQMRQHMMNSSSDMRSMKMTGDADRDFVSMMRRHHLSGIEMAKVELSKGKDDAARAMAQKIIDTQSREVREFDSWLTEHGARTSKR